MQIPPLNHVHGITEHLTDFSCHENNKNLVGLGVRNKKGRGRFIFSNIIQHSVVNCDLMHASYKNSKLSLLRALFVVFFSCKNAMFIFL